MSSAGARLRVLLAATLALAAAVAVWGIARPPATPPAEPLGASGPGVEPPAGTAALRPDGVRGRWRLIFDDEFGGRRLDTRRWQPNWLGGHDRAVTASPNSSDVNCVSPRQTTVRGGELVLTTAARACRANNGLTYRYASGLVTTRRSFHFTYGYLEARVYIPGRHGRPVNFPAVWADGTGHWPQTGELDVMEVLGSCGPGIGFHFHSPAGAPGGCAAVGRPTGWHTVGALWRRGAVTYYYDGRRVGEITSGVTGAPMYLILNNSMDPTLGGPNAPGSSMRVDWIRVWQRR